MLSSFTICSNEVGDKTGGGIVSGFVKEQFTERHILHPGVPIPRTQGRDLLPALSSCHSVDRLLTRIADHLYLCDSQVSVLVISFLHVAILCGIFCVFLHVMRGNIRYDASRSHCMTYMLGESDFTTPHFPGTAIIPGEQKLVGAITFC